jgi:hypothetical protein
MDGFAGGLADGGYVPPAIVDYGDLLEITRDTGLMLHMGIGTFATASSPGTPGGGGDGAGSYVAPGTAGDLPSSGDSPGGGDVSPAGGSGEVAGGDAGGGTDSGGGTGGTGGGGTGGGGGELPFSGFAAGLAGAVGAGLSAAGLAARKYLRRES